MVPVSRLPYLCLTALFKALPPGDRLSARKVCSRWNDLVVAASLRRRSLTLLIGSRTREEFASAINEDYLGNRVLQHVVKEDGTALVPPAAFTPWNSLLIDSLTEENAKGIVETFANTNQLLVVIGEAKPIDWQSLTSLLNTWSNQLVTFRLHIGIDNIVDTFSAPAMAPFLAQFFDALNSLAALKNLTLKMPQKECPMMPILARLEHFALYSLKPQPNFLPSLRQFADQSATLRQVAFTTADPRPTGENPLTDFLELSASLRACFTRLNTNFILPYICLQNVCANFASLTHLSIEAGPSLRVLFNKLAQLPRLLFLSLCVNFDTIDNEDPPVAQLVSVRALQLVILMNTPEQVPLLPIGSAMPNVQVIDVLFIGSCEASDIDNYDFGYDSEEDANRIEAEDDFEEEEGSYGNNEEDYDEDNAEDDWQSDSKLAHGPGKTCFRPLFAHWKRECPSLRKILYNFESVLGSAEELLEE